MYWNRASFAVRKIRYTARDVRLRLDEWKAQCNYIAEEQYHSPSKVRNVTRVERQVHAELKDFRAFEPGCHGCLKSHNEWFKDVGF